MASETTMGGPSTPSQNKRQPIRRASTIVTDDTDPNDALEKLLDTCSVPKALNTIIQTGAGTKSSEIRSAAAGLLRRLVEKLGDEKALTSGNGITDKILIHAVRFSKADAAAREHGRATLVFLHENSHFHGAIKRYLPQSSIDFVHDILSDKRRKRSDRRASTGIVSEQRQRNGGTSSRSSSSIDTSITPPGKRFSIRSDPAPTIGARMSRSVSTDQVTLRLSNSLRTELMLTQQKLDAEVAEIRLEGVADFVKATERHPKQITLAAPNLFFSYLTCYIDPDMSVSAAALSTGPRVLQCTGSNLSSHHTRQIRIEILRKLLTVLRRSCRPASDGQYKDADSDVVKVKICLDSLVQYVVPNFIRGDRYRDYWRGKNCSRDKKQGKAKQSKARQGKASTAGRKLQCQGSTRLQNRTRKDPPLWLVPTLRHRERPNPKDPIGR